MAQPRKADVLIADAEAVARMGMVQLINSHPGLRACGDVETLDEARVRCEREQPAVLLVLDVAMGDGLTFIKDLPRWSRWTRVVVYTALSDVLALQRALRAGAFGYATRRDSAKEVLGVIAGAAAGERKVGPRVERLLIDKLALGGVEMPQDEVSCLSNRELQVFRMIGGGMGMRDIGTELRLSVKTVESHRQRVKEKLGVRTSTELQRRAVLSVGLARPDA